MVINIPRAQGAAQNKKKRGKGHTTQHLGTFALPMSLSNRNKY